MSTLTQRSYGQVLQQVATKCDAVAEDRIYTLMRTCLHEMAAQLRDCPEYQFVGTFDTVPGQCDYELCDLLDHPVRAISQILGPDCCVLTPLASEDLLTKARCNDDQPGYELWGNVLTVYPTPTEACTFMVHAYRRPNDELFTDTLEPQEGEDKFGEPLPDIPVRRWNFIDLPEEFHAAYENCLIGLALCESGDASAGTKWLELAGAAFDTQKEVKDEGQTAPTSKVLKMDNWCRKPNPCCGTCGEEYGVIGGGCECAA